MTKEAISTERALKLALEALEETRNALAWFYDSYPQDVTKKGNELLPHVETVLTALRKALAEQPAPATELREQAPAGSVYRYGKDSSGKQWHGIKWTASGLDLPDGTLIYTSPPSQRRPLTVTEVEQILAQHNYEIHGDRARYIVRMTEAAHGIKENT